MNQFPTTAWTLLHEARNLPDNQGAERRKEFIVRYRDPVFHYIRAWGYPQDQAEDLTQEFLLKVMERDLVTKADPERGRFRYFFLRNLKFFLADKGPKRAPRQERFENKIVRVPDLVAEEDRNAHVPVSVSPEHIFWNQWAKALVKRALRSTEQRCKEEGRPDWWYRVFAARYDDGRATAPTEESLARENEPTRDQVRYALKLVERFFASDLRQQVREEVSSEADVEEEISELLTLLGPEPRR